MKKFWISFVAAAALVSCSQTEMKQTTDTIKQADSLFKSANDGIKTLDSISQIVKDSAKFNKVVVPEIEKHKKDVEKIIQGQAKNLDSINSVIKKTTEQINRSSEMIKTVDSARESLKNSKNPIEALSTISKTLEKVSKSARNTPQELPSEEPQIQTPPQQREENNDYVLPEAVSNPIVKTAKMKVNVDNVDDTRSQLATELYKYGGKIVTESIGEEQGIRKQKITAKVPYRYFDEATQSIAQNMGSLKTKSIETEGSDYDPDQMCDLEITFSENSQFASNEIITNSDSSDDKTYKDKSSDAFMKGFDGLKNVFLFLLPFWPVLIIAGIVYYFYRKNKRKREVALVEAKLLENQRYRAQEPPDEEPAISASTSETRQELEDPEDPYAKYKPKS